MITKGEWRNWSGPNGYHIWAGDIHIADVGDREDPAQSANANLIASAPDLYEALKTLIEYHQKYSGAIPCLADAIKALAKAEGK